MTRRVFYSFHYDADNWRAAMVRNIGNHCCPTNFRYPGGGVGVAGEPGAAGRGGRGAGGGRRG